MMIKYWWRVLKPRPFFSSTEVILTYGGRRAPSARTLVRVLKWAEREGLYS